MLLVETKGHELKVALDRFKTRRRMRFFIQGVVSLYKPLPQHTVEAKSSHEFREEAA